MIVLVDSPIWSLSLRRKPEDLSRNELRLVGALRDLIQQGRAKIVGPIRQELLSGIREPEVFRTLRNALRAFPDPALEAGDYEEAANMSNQCRRQGISGSATDFLICAVAHRRTWQVFTADKDFQHYGKALPFNLNNPAERGNRPS